MLSLATGFGAVQWAMWKGGLRQNSNCDQAQMVAQLKFRQTSNCDKNHTLKKFKLY